MYAPMLHLKTYIFICCTYAWSYICVLCRVLCTRLVCNWKYHKFWISLTRHNSALQLPSNSRTSFHFVNNFTLNLILAMEILPNQGYVLVGYNSTVCLDAGSWSVLAPTCVTGKKWWMCVGVCVFVRTCVCCVCVCLCVCVQLVYICMCVYVCVHVWQTRLCAYSWGVKKFIRILPIELWSEQTVNNSCRTLVTSGGEEAAPCMARLPYLHIWLDRIFKFRQFLYVNDRKMFCILKKKTCWIHCTEKNARNCKKHERNWHANYLIISLKLFM